MSDVEVTIAKFVGRDLTPGELELIRAFGKEHRIHDDDAIWGFVAVVFWACGSIRGQVMVAKEWLPKITQHFAVAAETAQQAAETAAERAEKAAETAAERAEKGVETALLRAEKAAQQRWFGKVAAVVIVAVAVLATAWGTIEGAVSLYEAGRADTIETVREHSPALAHRLFPGSR